MVIPAYIEARESPVYVRPADQRYFEFELAGVGSATWMVEDISTSTVTNVTATIMPSGSGSVFADYIKSPLAQSWTVGRTYRITAQYTKSGQTFNPYIRVIVLP